MSLVLSTAIVFGGVIAVNVGMRLMRARRRTRGLVPPKGEAIRHQAHGLPTRVFVDRTVPGGPKAGGINRDPASLAMTDSRLIVATGAGKLLELTAAHPGSGRCVGPDRLVVEGEHPSGRTHVRVELLISDAPTWATRIQALTPPTG